MVDCNADADNVNNGVNSADFMEMHFFRGAAMHMRFSMCQTVEDFQALFLHLRRQA